MSQFIAFVSPKGGSGATFACAGLWYSFAQKGKKVLAVDLCGKRASLDFALGFQNDSVYDVSDVVNGKCSLNEALCVSKVNPDACFLRAGADEEIHQEKERVRKEMNELYAKKVRQAEEEASKILATARQDATREKENIIASAQAEISEMVTAATEKIVLKASASEAFDQFLAAAEGGNNDDSIYQ